MLKINEKRLLIRVGEKTGREENDESKITNVSFINEMFKERAKKWTFLGIEPGRRELVFLRTCMHEILRVQFYDASPYGTL